MQLLKLVYLLLTITVVNTVPIPKEDPEVTHKVTFEVTQGDSYLGNLTLGLFGTATPLTAENFYELSKTKYKGSIFHRVIKDFMIQGGDFENGDGNGGYSIYGKKAGSLPDENFDLKHDRLGRLSMANSGKNTGGSQFFITNSITEWLDGQYVVFGQLLEGFETLNVIENSETKKNNNRPLEDIIISEVHYSKISDVTETKEQVDTETEDSTTNKEPPGEISVPSKEQDGVTETNDSSYKAGAPDTDLFGTHETESELEAEIEAERIHEEKEDSFNAPRKHIIVIPFLFVILLCVYAGVKFRKVIVFNIRGPRYRKI